MGKEILTFSDIEIEKNKLYRHKSHIALDIEKVLESKKISFAKKKAVSTLLLTFIMIIKLSHYI